MPGLMAMLCILAHYGKNFFPLQKSSKIDLPSALVKLINYSNLIDRMQFLNPVQHPRNQTQSGTNIFAFGSICLFLVTKQVPSVLQSKEARYSASINVLFVI